MSSTDAFFVRFGPGYRWLATLTAMVAAVAVVLVAVVAVMLMDRIEHVSVICAFP